MNDRQEQRPLKKYNSQMFPNKQFVTNIHENMSQLQSYEINNNSSVVKFSVDKEKINSPLKIQKQMQEKGFANENLSYQNGSNIIKQSHGQEYLNQQDEQSEVFYNQEEDETIKYSQIQNYQSQLKNNNKQRISIKGDDNLNSEQSFVFQISERQTISKQTDGKKGSNQINLKNQQSNRLLNSIQKQRSQQILHKQGIIGEQKQYNQIKYVCEQHSEQQIFTDQRVSENQSSMKINNQSIVKNVQINMAKNMTVQQNYQTVKSSEIIQVEEGLSKNKANNSSAKTLQNQENKSQNIANSRQSNQDINPNKVEIKIQLKQQNQTEKYQSDNPIKIIQQKSSIQSRKSQKQNQMNEPGNLDKQYQQNEHSDKKQHAQNVSKDPNQTSINHQQNSQVNQQKEPQSLTQQKQQSQQQFDQISFDLQKYKGVQQILQMILSELKSSLKFIKNDRPLSIKKQRNSKFIRRISNQGTQQKNRSKNKSLMDIMQRRKINSFYINEPQAYPHRQQSYQNCTPTNNQNNLKSNNHATNKKGQTNSVAVSQPSINRRKQIPLGLGNLGNIQIKDILRKQKMSNIQKDANISSDHISQKAQLQEKQRLIINRNKINQILAASNSNFTKTSNIAQREQNSFFIRQAHKQSSQQSGQVSFYHERSQSRKIIKSSNISKLKNKQMGSTTEIPSHKSTIERQRGVYKAHRQNTVQFYSITPLLKVVKKYLQVIAQGKIDNIQELLHHPNQSTLSYTNLNQLIHRKKLFKTAIYYQRASIISGVCYGYLLLTNMQGHLNYQVQYFLQSQQSTSKQNFQTMKQQTQQILKYMINLASFSLNNSKLICRTLEDHILKVRQVSLYQNERLDDQFEKNIFKDKKKLQVEKQIYKRNIETIRLNLQYMQQTFLKLFAENNFSLTKNQQSDQDFGQSFKNVSKLIQKNTIQQTFYTLLQYFSFFLCLIKRQRSIPFLAVAPNPYLDPNDKYTLIIDFIEIFCHGTKRSKNFIFRPYSQHFLNQMSQYFDIVVICDALPQQIDKIIDILDSKKVIKHRLYKYHMVEQKHSGKYMKSLERIGRDLQRTIMLDTQENRVSLQSKNTIFINQWKGSKNDSTLAELCSVLISISVQSLDCRKAALKIDNQMKINYQKGIKFINFGLNFKQMQKQQEQSGQLQIKKQQ